MSNDRGGLRMNHVEFTRPEYDLICDALAMSTADAQEYAEDPDDDATADQAAARLECLSVKCASYAPSFTPEELSLISSALSSMIEELSDELSCIFLSNSFRTSRVYRKALALASLRKVEILSNMR